MRQRRGSEQPVKGRRANGPKPRTIAASSIADLQKQVGALSRELQEALERQTATAEVLQVINSSPGDLAPVFEAMLDKALGLCGAAFGALWTYDGERMHAAAIRGMPPAMVEFLTRSPHPVGQDNAHARLLRGETVVHIADVADDKAYRSGDPIRRALVELGHGRSMLAVPLRKDKAFLGDFVIYRTEVKPFTDKQIALLENFAAQAVIAIENARLLTETREALERQTATAEVLQVINSSPGDLAPVFRAMLEKAMRLCDAKFGILWTYDGERFFPTALHGLPAAFAEFLSRPIELADSAALGDIAHARSFVHVADLASAGTHLESALRRATVDLGGARTGLGVPLHKGDVLLGIFVIYRQEVWPFSDKEIALVQNFAAQAVIAIENARLLGELRERQAELRTTFDNIGDGVAMFDAAARLAAWNRNLQEMLDLPDALLAKRPSLAELFSYLAARGEFGSADLEAQLRRSIEDTRQEMRYERTRPDGRVIEVRRNPVPGGGFVLIYSDITARKRAEEAIRAARDSAESALHELQLAQASLVHAQKMAALGQLTAGIAHEIKNPLNFVNNFAALSSELTDELSDVLKPVALPGKVREEVKELTGTLKDNLGRVVQHGKRADSIVKNMLLHSREGSGEHRRVEINAIIDESLNLAYHGARAEKQGFNITLERDFDPTVGVADIYPQEVTRVLLNLISNGFYAATQRAETAGNDFEPKLKAVTRNLGDRVEVRIRDNGTGIPPDIQEKIFNPFFTTKPAGEGTGLGLSLSHDIVVKQHGGTIEVVTEPGSFTELIITLPRVMP
jgi:two-component system NtrC family sensor kinase